MQQESIATRYNVIKFSFSESNLAASETGTAIPAVGADIDTYQLPYSGWIVGYSINKSAAHTAGSLDFDLEIDGTSTLTIAADTASVYAELTVGDEPFSAGSTLGVTYTSDASLEAVTVDVVIDVYVIFDMTF